MCLLLLVIVVVVIIMNENQQKQLDVIGEKPLSTVLTPILYLSTILQ